MGKTQNGQNKLSIQVPMFFEGSLEVKLPTIWTDGKAEVGRVREEKRRREKIREEKESEKKEDAGARKGRKVAKHMICGSGGSKSRLAKVAGAEPSGQMRDEKSREAHSEVKVRKTPHVRTTFEVEMSKKCTPLWREARLEVKMYKAHHSRTPFGS